LLETRQSGRVQDQLLKNFQKQDKDDGKKRTLEGMISPTSNSFFVLNNDVLADLARDMGVNIPEGNFYVIDMMKDLECARRALEKG
jgi:hypothetical protein